MSTILHLHRQRQNCCTVTVIWKLAAFFLWTSVCFAQQYEFGGTIGYGFYRNTSVGTPDGTVATGIGNRLVFGAVLTEDQYQHVSGELRYLFQHGGPFVSQDGQKVSISGQSHTVTYEILLHLKNRNARLRPYVAIGGGIKYFQPTGSNPAVQPFPGIVTLTNAGELRWVASPGAGVKYRASRHVILRADFRDYINPFPHKLFIPVQGARGRGILHQFTPLFGVSYSF